jgi:hypothetical protein
MKSNLFFILFLVFISNLYSQPDTTEIYLPIQSGRFIIHYDPSTNNTFSDPQNLIVLYTLDYWDVPFARELSDSLLIAKCTESKRKKSVEMVKKSNIWEAQITISPAARILSYIITDGKKYDLNNRKTYAFYIYSDKKMKPVRESCLYMMQLYDFTKRSYDLQLEEIKSELEYYPANFTAYYFYWKILLYRSGFRKDIVSRVETEMAELYHKYSQNPEACNVVGKVYFSGLLSNEKTFAIVSGIPTALLGKEIKNKIFSEKSSREFKKKREMMMNSKTPDFEAKDLYDQKIKLSELNGKAVLLHAFVMQPQEELWKPQLDSIQKINDYFKNKSYKTIVICSYDIMRKFYAAKNPPNEKPDSTNEINNMRKIFNEKGYNFSVIKYDGNILNKLAMSFNEYCIIDKEGILRFLDQPRYRSTQVFYRYLKEKIGEYLNK